MNLLAPPLFNGTKEWRDASGQRHRTDGPALEYADGYKEWWIKGQIHRTDGPAAEYADGDKEWWINGELHRTDGPAVEYADDHGEWYLEGENLTETEHRRRVIILELAGVK